MEVDRRRLKKRVPARKPNKSASLRDDTQSLVGAAASSRQLDELLEHNLIGIYRTRLDGKILDCNESMARMLGYASRAELLAHAATELYPSPAERDEFIRRLQATGVLTNSELRLKRRDGTIIHILENVSLTPDEQGEPTIIQGTMVDISEHKRAEGALRESERRYRALAGELRGLMQRVHAVREEERTRIARELHDELGQALTALNMDLYWLRGRVGQDVPATQARIASMGDLVNRTMQSVRRICADLRPAVLDDFGLTAAIEWQAREFQSRTGIRCGVSLPAVQLNLPGEQRTAVFRIFQESLTNVARHARATDVVVTLRVRPEMLLLHVRDNGIGISPTQASAPHALGLAGMRERALSWGGQVRVRGRVGKGTAVMLRMPVNSGAEESGS